MNYDVTYETIYEDVLNLGLENITPELLKEWEDKLPAVSDTIHRKYIQNHIVAISNLLYSEVLPSKE